MKSVIILTFSTVISGLIFAFSVIAGIAFGNFLAVKIMFPYAMIIAELQNIIEIPAIIIAIAQFPIYVFIQRREDNWKYYALGLHILAMLVCIYLKSERYP